MSELFEYHEGDLPLLISVPHDGRRLPDEQRERMTGAGLDIPDTDWHVAELYDFAREFGASMIVANYSRYVVDVNRPASDAAMYEGQVATGLCPQYTFAGDPRVSRALLEIAEASPYESVLNGRFKGGYITRHYGDPEREVHAVQLELAQRAYMNEVSRDYDDELASSLRRTLRQLLDTFVASATVQ
jgi:N-formylglutamate amidohydrolase